MDVSDGTHYTQSHFDLYSQFLEKLSFEAIKSC